jgi:hypothetical protein
MPLTETFPAISKPASNTSELPGSKVALRKLLANIDP